MIKGFIEEGVKFTDMAAVCQDSSNPGSNLFGGSKGLQGPSSHNYYGHCGYEAPNEGPHQYTHDGYGQYQMPSLHHQQQQLHPHHPHHPHLNHPHHQSHHHQQTWGSYGMGVAGVMGSTRSPHPIPISDEWAHGYLMAGNNGSPQTPYGYQYRPTNNSHTSPLDYGTPPHPADSSDPQCLEDSMSPQTPSPRGSSPSGSTMGPNNQGAKSLRAPYEWMKSSASLPTIGHGAVIAGKTRTKDKYRVVYSDHQRLELEKEFHFSKYITIRRKAEIAGQLGLSERQVKIWFQNRRAKERKQNKKREEQAMNQHTSPQNQVNNKDNNQLQQQQNYITSSTMQHHLQQNDHVSAASYLIPKLEVDEDVASATKINNLEHHNDLSNMARMGYHNTTQSSSIPTSEQVMLAMNGTNTSSAMTAPGAGTGSILMDHYHAQNPVNRFHHEGYPLPPHVMSPGNHMADDMMTNNLKMTPSNSSSNSMNLSGSSDSGVLSSQ